MPHQIRVNKPRIQNINRVRHRFSAKRLATMHAAHAIQPAVEIYYPQGPCFVVKRINILCHHARKQRVIFSDCYRVVAAIGLGGREPAPPHVTSQPVTLSVGGRLHEIAEGHRVLFRRPHTPIIRNS
jgi:hypothetical protein